MLDEEEDKLRSSLTKKVEAIMTQYRKERKEFEMEKGLKPFTNLNDEEKVTMLHTIRKTFDKSKHNDGYILHILPKTEQKFPIARNMSV